MMILTKQPAEERTYRINFRNKLAPGDVVYTVTSITVDEAGLTLSEAEIDGQKISFLISGGTDGVNYKITALVVTANGDTVEGDVMLEVRDQ